VPKTLEVSAGLLVALVGEEDVGEEIMGENESGEEGDGSFGYRRVGLFEIVTEGELDVYEGIWNGGGRGMW